jgi:MFS family permease
MASTAQPLRPPLRPHGGGFHALWLATASSNLGDGVALVAAPLLAATLTADPAAIAGLTFAQRVPWLLFPLLGGVLADRLDRRRLMVGVACARAALVGALAAALLTGHASLPLLYAVFFLLSSGETLFDTAATTILPALVPREELPRANARLSAALTVTNQFVGPPLGGALFAIAVALPFLAGAGGLAAAALLLLTLRGTFRAPAEARMAGAGLLTETLAGFRWLRQ